jgi:hypothetical protein
MEEQVLAVAAGLAERFVRELRGDMIDGRTLVKGILVGYLCGSGVPTDEAVAAVEQMVAKGLVGQTPRNPMYHCIPWMIPGPVSGAPYYSDR